jgi:hypothetical protein
MKNYVLLLSACLVFANNQYPTESQINAMIKESMQLIWETAMESKKTINQITPNVREELLSNLCSSAPNTSFHTHCDLSDSLSSLPNTEAKVFISNDDQISWIENDDVQPLNIAGFENTWSAITSIPNMQGNAWWYLSGSLDSESLGLNFGQATVSQSPYNESNVFPIPNNLLATLANDDPSDGTGGSGQDIVNLKASYSDDQLYTSLELNGSCCSEGGFFGPWNLYVIAIVNPDNIESPVAYAYAYGNGGFGQLYPGIYKIQGDFISGEVGDFGVISTDFDYNLSGNSMQARSLLSTITEDADWGVWPNSYEGVGLVGVTISAGLSGLSISTDILDTSDVGLLVMSTQSQTSNSSPILSDTVYEDGILSVVYTDVDNNLATVSDVFVDDMGFVMTPDSHVYSEGVTFSANIGSGYNYATLSFSDGSESVQLEVELGSGCEPGDANTDNLINVLDIVSTTNLILSEVGEYNPCSDVNNDGDINVLDIVALVNLILSGRN